MKSTPPQRSRSIDELWDVPDEDEEDLPPALAPSLQGKHVSQEDRDTLVPPVPPAEYVQTMMKLGELDEPLDQARFTPPPFAPPTPPPLTPPPQTRPFGLVLAPESELLLDGAADPGSASAGVPATPPPAPFPGSRRRSTGSFAAVRPKTAVKAPAPGRPWTPPDPFHGAAARAALPVPRAPSVRPEPEPDPEVETVTLFEGLETVEGLDTLDGLGPFLSGELQTGNTPPGPPVMLAGEPRRLTPPALSAPTSSKPQPTSTRKAAPAPAGFRLGKRAPEPLPDLDPPASEPAPNSLHDRAREMVSLFAANNYSSALVLAESVLHGDPHHTEARLCAERCREALTEKYLGSLGGRRGIPRVAMGAEEIRWLSLDHRAGFLLSTIDGSMTVDEVLDVSSMPELDALRIMFELRNQGAIEVVVPNRRPGRR
jgi:hypothetical protein